MLIVKTYLKEVKGKGIGLFSGQKIKKDEIVWQEDNLIDRTFSHEVIENLPQILRDFFEKYASFQADGTIYLCGDNARFFNHSYSPNCLSILDSDGIVIKNIAARGDIEENEELTIDYRMEDEPSKIDLGFKYME